MEGGFRSGRPLLAFGAGVAVIAAIWFRLTPTIWPMPDLHSYAAEDGALRALNPDNPDTPAHPTSEQPIEEGSDRALFREWLQASSPSMDHLPLTIGGAIAEERPIWREQQAEERRDRARVAAEVAQQVSQSHAATAEAAVEAAQQQAQRDAEQRHIAAMNAEESAADARAERQQACNMARISAHSTSRSPGEFISWIRAHPCADGTDVGDGYWNVAH